MTSVRSWLCFALAVAPAGLACSSDETSSQDGTAPTPASPDAGEAGAPAGLPPAPPFSIVPEADTGCVATTSAAPVPLDTKAHLVTDLGRTGDRVLARALDGSGFFTFDADGAAVVGPIATGTEVRAAGSADGVVAVGVDSTSQVEVGRFAPSGEPAGAAQKLGPARPGRPVAVGTSGDEALVVWAAPPSEVRARALDADGAPGTAFALETGADFDDLTVAIAPSTSANDASSFLVVWALRRLALDAHRVYAALVRREGIVGLPRIVLGDSRPVRIVGLATHPSGAVLLANVDSEPVVVPLDVLGRVAGPAHLLAGTDDPLLGGGHGLALEGDAAAVVARHASGADALRILDLDGRPREGWICLDAPAPDDFHLGGVAGATGGWSAVVATPTGSSLLKLDATGRAAR